MEGTFFDNRGARFVISQLSPLMSAKSRFEELAKAHQAIVGMLESPLLSRPTREQLETFRQELEDEIAAMNQEKAEGSIAS